MSCVISKMRLNVLNIYHPNDLNLQNKVIKNSRQGWLNNIPLFVTLNAKNVKNELKRETSGPFEGDIGPFWARSTSKEQNVGPPGAPATCYMCQTSPTHCHMLQKSSSLPLVASCPSKPSSHLQGLIPPRSNLCQSVLVRASFCLLHARAHHDIVLPLPSQ